LIAEKEEGIDYLVNNAGAAWGEPFESFSESRLGQSHGS
jgi:NADP-dependent 3-hydroxy acid dehydrogenase YdfG